LLPKNRKDCFFFICLGALLAIHWISYFKSIQLSTVAIGLLTFSTFPVFVTFLEPCFLRNKIELKDIIISLITFLGVALVIPKFQFNNNMTQGALWGIFSGFTFAILSILNKKNTKEYSGLLITFYETAVSTVLLIPFMLVSKPIFNSKDILLLIVLGVVFTGISHSLFVSGMSTVKAQTASIISTLEPVYGIISTAILFGEIPTPKVIVGGLIILGTSIYSSIN
jgi:drug/metabolite transporter (DMT)-like permease